MPNAPAQITRAFGRARLRVPRAVRHVLERLRATRHRARSRDAGACAGSAAACAPCWGAGP